jgi:hypothetical protein
MQYDGGRYRDALVEHLSQLYSDNLRRASVVQSLSELTGVQAAELDQQYGEFLKSTEASLSRESTRLSDVPQR